MPLHCCILISGSQVRALGAPTKPYQSLAAVADQNGPFQFEVAATFFHEVLRRSVIYCDLIVAFEQLTIYRSSRG